MPVRNKTAKILSRKTGKTAKAAFPHIFSIFFPQSPKILQGTNPGNR